MIRFFGRLLAIILAAGLCFGAAIAVYSALGEGLAILRVLPTDLSGPVSADQRQEIFTIEPGQSAAAVGEELQRRGLVRSALVFRWEIEARGLESRLEAGEYELSPSMSTAEVVAALSKGATSRGVTLTVPEGWRAEQLARRIEELGLARAEEFLQVVHAPREAGLQPPDAAAESLEGYLFPETYQVDPEATPRQIADMMLQHFWRRYGPQLQRQVAERGLSLHQAVTLASIVEREAAQPPERPLVAAVYLNRLAADMPLQADPTVQYAVANADLDSAATYDFWKRDLTLIDLEVDSPFNTYRRKGLPPRPICSPGLDSLRAVAEPANTNYLYFVARGDGSHAFAETHEQHEANVRQYR